MRNLKFLISPAFMGILFVVFALAMAVATFIGNDYGQAASYEKVYNTKWFELIMLLLAVNLAGQMFAFRLFRRSRLTGALFHLSFILILAGAAITRYTGWEGTMHIREGNAENKILSAGKYFAYNISDNQENMTVSGFYKFSGRRFKKNIDAGGDRFRLVLEKVIPNAYQKVTDDPTGEPVVSFFVSDEGMSGENVVIRRGELKVAAGVSIGFGSASPSDLVITSDSGKLFVTPHTKVSELSMMTRSADTIAAGERRELKRMQVLGVNNVRVITRAVSAAAIVEPVEAPAGESTGQNAFIFSLTNGKESATVDLWENTGEPHSVAIAEIAGKKFEISYGSKALLLPFSIRLNDFILERYPGSSSPSGFKSDVVLVDKGNNLEKPFVIFMNNILRYKGFRFYQSSYDKDEKGTVLSVNHDVAGMMVTYTGYGLLFLFIILTLFNKSSIFHNITSGYWTSNLRNKVAMVILFGSISCLSVTNAQQLIPAKSVADEFGRVLVQDQKGRTKPLFTMSNDILRKVTRENRFEGLVPMQVFLGFYLDFEHWKDVPLIAVSDGDLRSKLGINRSRASFTDIVNMGTGAYKLSADVEKAYNKAPGERSKSDKEIMKIDERVNILYMIYKGDFLKMFPLRDGSHNWGTVEEALGKARSENDSIYLKSIIPALAGAVGKGDAVAVSGIRTSIASYQEKFAGYELPASSRTTAEMLYYRLNIFEKLFPFYATAGILMLVFLVSMVITGKKQKALIMKILSWLLFAGYLMHTFGLGLRWYIAGHSPMSNGYESMLFISWVTLLAGFLFSRKSSFTLSATAVLASMTLMVAHLSFMDPEITNLVPVLKSYWLTLHVSVITGSYGFLGLGAILSLITLVLLSFAGTGNRERISTAIDELTVINYKTLTLGLYFLTIGTFLGAVWANESWGRYWGWDPKETWSLITIVVYSIVVHSRMIPGMKDIFTFNLLSLFAFSSVLMTYFGVNYYLSGLHSYAAGDSVPVPSFVYITIVLLAALSFFAYSRYQKLKV